MRGTEDEQNRLRLVYMYVPLVKEALEAASSDRHLSQPVGQQVAPRQGWFHEPVGRETKTKKLKNMVFETKTRRGMELIEYKMSKTHDKNEDM